MGQYLSQTVTITGHKFLKDEFNYLPRVGWQIDPFGHSNTHAWLSSAVGFDSLFFGRIDYQDRAKRMAEKNMEMVWKGSASDPDQAVFTGIFFLISTMLVSSTRVVNDILCLSPALSLPQFKFFSAHHSILFRCLHLWQLRPAQWLLLRHFLPLLPRRSCCGLSGKFWTHCIFPCAFFCRHTQLLSLYECRCCAFSSFSLYFDFLLIFFLFLPHTHSTWRTTTWIAW